MKFGIQSEFSFRLASAIVGAITFSSVPSAAATVPEAPTNVTVGSYTSISASNYSAQVRWNVSSSNGGDSILGYNAVAVEDTSKHCAANASLSCSLTNLTWDSSYSFVVYAKNAIGSSVASAPSSSSVVSDTNSQIIVVTPGNGELTASWTLPPSRPDLCGWYFDVGVNGNTESCNSITGTTCTIMGLTNGVSYKVTILNMDATETNDYGVTECDYNGIVSVSNSYPVTPNGPVGIYLSGESPSSFNVHLNGSSLEINLPQISKNALFSMVDIEGHQVWSKSISPGTLHLSLISTLNGHSLNPGVYIIRLVSQNDSNGSRVLAESKVLLTP